MHQEPKPMLIRKVLFICLGNSCRSIMAEALVRHRCGERWDAASAGLYPLGLVAPETLTVLAELGVATVGLRSKGLDEFDLSEFHFLVNLSDRALDGRLPGVDPDRLIQRPVPDPYGASLSQYRRSRDAITQLIMRDLCGNAEPGL
jgi:protein-tyrosine-phosphatase